MKTVPLSARVSQEDAEFIARLEIDGAKTPSEKLRVLIREAREAQEGEQDYRASLKQAERLLAPSFDAIRHAELGQPAHSEILAKVHEWLPEFVAFIRSRTSEAEAISKPGLRELEKGVVERLMRLLEALMRMAVTPDCPCYDASLLDQQLDAILDLAAVINARKQSEKE